jgi:pyruvate dehydrogenase E2 component (dihydrolipoyllysine-residue acetyltransferase)
MPSLGADMDRGKILEWRKQVGEPIARGEIVALVDTDKAEIEVESFTAGVLDAILVGVGETVPVGTPIARIRGAQEPSAAPPPQPAAPPPPARPVPPPSRPAPPPVHPPGERSHASPLARRVAAELGVDLVGVAGTGPDGAITRADVERAAGKPVPLAPAAAPAAAAPPRDRAAAMRSAIAAAMERANREIPHYYLETRVDLTRALAWLADQNTARPLPDRILPAALFVKALARAAREVPELNGFWRDGAFVPGDGVHVGVIVSLRQGGLLAPALHDAADKTLAQVMAELRDVVARARAGKLRSSEVSGATISLTNLGDQGAERVYGVIMPPQVALIGFGRVTEQPVAVDGLVGVHRAVDVTLAGDHRASDGHRGSRFLAALARHLQAPEGL